MWPPPPGLPDPQADRQQSKRLPTGYRVLTGFGGAVVGLVIGFAAALLFAFKAAGGDDFGGAMLCLITVPVGLLIGAIFGVVMALRVLSRLQQPDPDGKGRRKKAVLAASLLFGVPASTVGMFWAVMHSNDPPSDQQLLANFSRHHAEFNQLASMAQVDKGLERVDSDWTRPDDPQTISVSPARIAEYRRLLSRAGTPRGFQTVGGTGSMEFFYWLTGSAISSDTDKGYAYMTKPPANVLNSLDQCQPFDNKSVEAYRHIEGNWYLIYDYLPG